jgi:outer membrane protein OmpA-like peptidoglycan-associated protein
MLANAMLGAAAAVFLTPQAACPIIIVENFSILQFSAGSAELPAPARELLDRWVATVASRTYPTRFELVGQTDRVGRRDANQRLSHRRADAVRRYLISRGVSGDLISMRAQGEDFGLVETADEVAEPTNRVVQLLAVADPRERRATYACESSGPATR